MKTFLILILPLISFYSCTDNDHKNTSGIAFPDSTYKVENGFQLELVAAEPLIIAPVAIDFDNEGKLWVVEMRGYMPTLSGDGEDKPVGRISVLDDFDENGVAQRSTVFIDSLVLPRAIAHVYGGLLYAEPPNLWFVEINNGKPGKRTLVDSLYAAGGYVEMQPNGLMMNIDNWIYSANSNSRYQMRNGEWVREATTFRGQWGITKDNYGRLYYNYNEVQLAGDHVIPNTVTGNRFFVPKESENKVLTDNQRVYALHPTTVNRGYEPGILTNDSMLKNFTAACGPMVYRGDNFPEEYYQNVFVCEPQANLIKRNILSFDSVRTKATQAWDNKEFLASSDESFRPVTLMNAPDGSIYVVDMHRGVLEHRAVASPYYREEIAAKKLDTLLSGGRIIRIKNKSKALERFPDFAHSDAAQLVKMLSSGNGWVRDRAQQLLVQQQNKSVVPQLESLVKDITHPLPALHALYVLDALQSLNRNLLFEIARTGQPYVTAHALKLLNKLAKTRADSDEMNALLKKLAERNNEVIDLYSAATLGSWVNIAPDVFVPQLKRLSDKYSSDLIFQEAVVSGTAGHEEEFARLNAGENKLRDSLFSVVAGNRKDSILNPIFAERKLPTETRAHGMVLFRKTCAACHGADGEGIEHVGPPLRESQFVQGSPDRLAMIILNGLEGPIHINGKEYQFNGSMPAFAGNFSDEEIADIIRYLRNSYVSNRAGSIDVKQITALRKKPTGTLTEEKLKSLKP